jgi:sporulation protein YlmC with PRC-barrel domain
MKTAGFKSFLLLVSAIFISSLAYADDKMESQSATPGVKTESKSGMKTGDDSKQKEGYHYKSMGGSMETKRAGEIIGKSVVSQDGKNLGTLHDLVIFGKGFIHYGILALEDRKDEYVAIPFNVLESGDDKDKLTLQMDSKKVKGAPSFSMEEITDWDNSEIGDKVHKYFDKEMMKGDTKYPHGKKPDPGTGTIPESGTRKSE